MKEGNLSSIYVRDVRKRLHDMKSWLVQAPQLHESKAKTSYIIWRTWLTYRNLCKRCKERTTWHENDFLEMNVELLISYGVLDSYFNESMSSEPPKLEAYNSFLIKKDLIC